MVNTVKAHPAQPATRRSDLHCTCCGGALALPRTLAKCKSGPPLPTLALGRSAKRAFHRASRAARSARSLRHHHQEATCACYRGGSTCRRLGAQPPIDTGRVARGGEQAAAGARAHSAHAIGAERVAQGGDGSQRLCRPRHTGAQRPRCAASSGERVARGGDQASRGRRARSAHAIGAERVTRSDAGSHARSGCPLSHPHPRARWEAPAF